MALNRTVCEPTHTGGSCNLFNNAELSAKIQRQRLGNRRRSETPDTQAFVPSLWFPPAKEAGKCSITPSDPRSRAGNPNGAKSCRGGAWWRAVQPLRWRLAGPSEQPRRFRNATTRHLPLPTEHFGLSYPGEDTDRTRLPLGWKLGKRLTLLASGTNHLKIPTKNSTFLYHLRVCKVICVSLRQMLCFALLYKLSYPYSTLLQDWLFAVASPSPTFLLDKTEPDSYCLFLMTGVWRGTGEERHRVPLIQLEFLFSGCEGQRIGHSIPDALAGKSSATARGCSFASFHSKS